MVHSGFYRTLIRPVATASDRSLWRCRS